MLEIPRFKIRCSAIGNIMGGRFGLTDIQELKLIELKNKPKLTVRQSEELDSLIYKKEHPELPKSLQTYCLLWLKGKMFERQKQLYTFAIEKGNAVEDESIEFIAKMLGYPYLCKNTKFFENEYIIGTPDILPGNTVIDAKNSWSWETFPLFEDEPPTEGYVYQLHGYMAITGQENAKLCYVLSDTPIHLIMRKAKQWCIENGYEDVTPDIYKKFNDMLTYTEIPDIDKFRCFNVARDESVISEIIERVKMCREFLQSFIDKKYKDRIVFV